MDTTPHLTNGSVNGDLEHANGNGASPSDASSSTELSDFVKKIFSKHFVLTLCEFKRLFGLHLAEVPAGQVVVQSMSDFMLQDAILQNACRQIHVPFPSQTKLAADEQKVFCLWETGNDSDKLRHVLFELFSKNYRIKRTMLQSKLSEEVGEIPKTDIDRLLKECCISSSGMWYLKGTCPS
ncbi:hypothetical protein WMY93_013627 [Mugilogobius chulae]|uniref:DNA-directed RNA polymerase III subunit RPC5 C-terminal domain-containing protein n=1 Tax=Mugilogobius chulae TaxID=88201 RepID=A0AAW0P0I6_9GOBI